MLDYMPFVCMCVLLMLMVVVFLIQIYSFCIFCCVFFV